MGYVECIRLCTKCGKQIKIPIKSTINLGALAGRCSDCRGLLILKEKGRAVK